MDAITVRCSACDNVMRFGADKAGRTAKCSRCKAPVPIPAAGDEPAGAAPPPMPVDDDGPADYGLVDVGAAKAGSIFDEEPKAKEKDKKKLPKLQRKTKALPDREEWEKVRTGLLFMFFGIVVAFVIHLLHGLYVALGNVEFPEYARGLFQELERRGPIPPPGRFWAVDQLNMFLSMIAGPGFVGLARGILGLCFILAVVQSLVWFVGYGFCFAVPNRFGTTNAVGFATAFGVVNFLTNVFVRLLPVLGVYNLILIPLLVPEVALTVHNVERSLPINVLWSGAPFWENLATITIEFVMVLEMVVFADFLWSVGMSVKDRRIEDRARALVQIGLGQYFILLAYHMMAICGTTMVLVIVLRVLYVTWFCFATLFLAWYAGLLLKTREVLADKINPANEAD